MNKLEHFKNFFLGRDRMGDNTSLRQKGSTTALLREMISNPDAVMLVHNHHMKRQLAKRYGLDENRFLNVHNGIDFISGKQFNGPVLVDLCAIAELLEQVQREYAQNEMERKNDQNKTLQKENDALKEANAVLRVTCQSIRDQLDHLIENT